MGKTIAKFAYWAIAIVLGIVVYIGVYEINLVEQVQDKISSYVKEKDTTELARIIGGGLFDSTNLADGITTTDKYSMTILSGAIENSGRWYDPSDSLNERYYHNYDEAYYIYVFDLSYSLYAKEKDGDGNETTIYKSGLRFYSGDTYYDYYLNLGDSYNNPKETDYEEKTAGSNTYNSYSSSYNGYISKPTSEKELLLNNSRELSKYYNNYSFLCLTISEDQIKCIEEILGSDITSFDLLNGYGNAVSASPINFTFDFKESFYEKASSVFDAYELYLPIADKYNGVSGATYAGDVSDNLYNDANNTLNTSIQEFTYKLSNKELFTDYKTIYTSASQGEVISLSSIVTKSIIVIVIYVVSVIVIFVLIFYIKRITQFVTRGKNRNNNYRPRPNIEPKKESIDASVKEVNNDNKDNKEETNK